MKKHKSLLFVFPILACVVLTPVYASENVKDQKQAEAYKPPGHAILEKMMERSMPSEKTGHSILPRLSGTWNYSASFWTDSKTEPQKTMGTVTNEMIMDGRFLSSDSLGTLSIGGSTVDAKSRGLIGYDTVKKAYTSVWVDTLGSGMMIGQGKYDEKEKVIKETGKFTDPLDGVEKTFRSELRFSDDGSYKRTIFTANKAGKEAKLMEIEYTRKM